MSTRHRAPSPAVGVERRRPRWLQVAAQQQLQQLQELRLRASAQGWRQDPQAVATGAKVVRGLSRQQVVAVEQQQQSQAHRGRYRLLRSKI